MEDRKLISRWGALSDFLFTAIFFIFMTSVCMTHVPAETTKMQVIWGSFCALPLTGIFWIALGLFRVTLVDMKERRKEGKDI